MVGLLFAAEHPELGPGARRPRRRPDPPGTGERRRTARDAARSSTLDRLATTGYSRGQESPGEARRPLASRNVLVAGVAGGEDDQAGAVELERIDLLRGQHSRIALGLRREHELRHSGLRGSISAWPEKWTQSACGASDRKTDFTAALPRQQAGAGHRRHPAGLVRGLAQGRQVGEEEVVDRRIADDQPGGTAGLAFAPLPFEGPDVESGAGRDPARGWSSIKQPLRRAVPERGKRNLCKTLSGTVRRSSSPVGTAASQGRTRRSNRPSAAGSHVPASKSRKAAPRPTTTSSTSRRRTKKRGFSSRRSTQIKILLGRTEYCTRVVPAGSRRADLTSFMGRGCGSNGRESSLSVGPPVQSADTVPGSTRVRARSA